MINVLLNIILFAVKFIGGKLSRSVSVTADAFNNLSDAGTTLASYWGVKIASIGAGEHHPNGHGRFEWVVALLSATSVVIIGWELAKESIAVIKNPVVTVFNAFTIFILILSIMTKLFMYVYNRKKGKEMNLASYKAIAIDSISDAIATSAVFISLIFYKLTGINIDGWCGVIVAGFIIYNGYQSFSETASRIMGEAPSKEEVDAIKDWVMRNPDFQDVYDLQIEDYGYGRHRISMIVRGKENISGNQLLRDIAEVTAEIYKEFAYSVLIGIEKPANDLNEENIRHQVEAIIDTQNVEAELISMRINDAVNKKIICMEIGIPHSYVGKFEHVEKNIRNDLNNLSEEYVAIPKIRMLRKHGKKRW